MGTAGCHNACMEVQNHWWHESFTRRWSIMYSMPPLYYSEQWSQIKYMNEQRFSLFNRESRNNYDGRRNVKMQGLTVDLIAWQLRYTSRIWDRRRPVCLCLANGNFFYSKVSFPNESAKRIKTLAIVCSVRSDRQTSDCWNHSVLLISSRFENFFGRLPWLTQAGLWPSLSAI